MTKPKPRTEASPTTGKAKVAKLVPYPAPSSRTPLKDMQSVLSAAPSPARDAFAPDHVCPLFKEEVQTLVVAVVQAFHPHASIALGTRFQEDLGVDPTFHENYYSPIANKMAYQNCRLRGISQVSFRAFSTVGELADAVFTHRS